MQYFAAFALVLFWTVNKLQCSDRVNNTSTHIAKLVVMPKPAEGVGKPVVLGKETESLNLTCHIIYQKTERNDIPLPNETPLPVYIVDWKVLHQNNNRNQIFAGTRFESGQSVNNAWLWFERLTEADAGDYTCRAIPRNSSRQRSISNDIHLSVQNKVGTCDLKWFKCHSTHCIRLRYLCDGLVDCPDGEDETAIAGCGPDPCVGKVFCGERCLPPAWCCDLGNCNSSSQPAVRPDPPGIISTEHHPFNDLSFLQTTIYTVIGCAMAFMFIVTILVIMICRVHMKRAMNSRCPQQVRNPGPRPRHSVPLYDLDVYLNRAADLNNQRGVTVTYNINNGVQFVGRPVEPPPYSEIAPVPPREGPPPPYVSHENLLDTPPVSNLNSTTALRVNSHTLTAPFTNNEGTAVRIPSTYQNNPNSSSLQCFTSRQVPGPQATPGFNRFNMNLICDDASNTTLNTSDSTALNTSSNSDSSSNNSVSNYVICRNITSHSQNFEPEYTETDSLLIENQHADPVSNTDRSVRSSENPCTFLHAPRALGVRDAARILESDASSDVPLLQSETVEDQNLRETSNNEENNFDLRIDETIPVSLDQCKPQMLKMSETQPSFVDTKFEISLSTDSKSSRACDDAVKKSISVGISPLCNRDTDSTLQRLSSKTVLDLSVVGETSKNNLASDNSETTRSLPFHLNLNNPLVGCGESNSDKHGSGPLMSNIHLIKPDTSCEVLKINDSFSTSDPVKYTKISTSRKDSGGESRNVSSSHENLATCADDSKTFGNQSMERFPAYLKDKDDQMLRVPLVTDGDSSVSYNNLPANLTTNDVLGDGTKIILSDDGVPAVRETQPLVMPLRESFIGVRKEE